MNPGLASAQTAHAAFQFAVEHPEVTAKWHEDSSYLVVLGVPDEDTLLDYADLAHWDSVEYSLMVEPDLGGQHTSLAIGPSDHLWKKLSDLPLLGREFALS